MRSKQFYNQKIGEKYFTKKCILIFFLITLAVYLFMYFVSMPLIAEFSGGLPILDLKSEGYSYAYATNLLETLGKEGRSTYLFPQLTLDMFFPLAYVPFLVLLTGLLLKKNRWNGTFYDYSLLIPILTGLADYGENIGSILLIHSYPNISEGLVYFTSASTVLKSIGLVISLLLVVFYGVWYLLYGKKQASIGK
ncbi:MAG: hypothetical protein LUH22_12260 [Bacteroides sp.]|nr:hypothetical protein [Bacteroides sp.]